MKNFLFYLFTVLIWGSTWIGIKLQLGIVDPMVSVTYRFALAAILLLLWCWIRGMKMRFTLKEHGYMLMQGLLLFGFNYLMFYEASLYLTSGLTAVIFSTVVVMNIMNGAIFLGSCVDSRVVFGGGIGLVGMGLVFGPEISGFSLESHGVLGILLGLGATLLASLGNITSARNQKNGLPIVQTNAYGMTYGAIAMGIVSLVCQKQFLFDPSFVYVGSLLFLVVFGSIIAFGCYLSLVGNIGADRAAYATLLFPLVALVISTIWEGYQWTPSSLAGVGLIVLGNFSIIYKKTKTKGKFLRPGFLRVRKV
jgi:drug/metabolite transporter (DMT)-like permease